MAFGFGRNSGKRGFQTWPGFWFMFLGISAAVTLLMPSLVIVTMITIIGIPIGLSLMAAPFLFLLAAGSKLYVWAMGDGRLAKVTGMFVTFMVLAVPPYLVNRSFESSAQALVAGDHDTKTMPRAKVIAVRSPVRGRRKDGPLPCDDFCQRALLNGIAERILVVDQNPLDLINPNGVAAEYRMEARARCPEVKLERSLNALKLSGDKRDKGTKRADELMNLEIAKGHCLIAGEARLSDADIILSVGKIKRGKSKISAGLSLGADTVSADRITMHERKDDIFIETYRWTGVTVHTLLPVYAPTVEGGSELRAYAVLARKTRRLNIDDKYYQAPDWAGFLTDRLGYDLALRDGEARKETRSVLTSAVLRTDTANDVPVAVASDFFAEIRQVRKIDGADLEIASQILSDASFPVPSDAWAAVKYADDADADYFDTIGDAMFRRLRAFQGLDEGRKYPSWGSEARQIGMVIQRLPASTIRRHRADLDWLANSETVRVPAYLALMRYSEFGEAGTKPLIGLIDDAKHLKSKKGNEWQHPYLAGMIGLCKTGSSGNAAIKPLLTRLDDGTLATHGSYWKLTINTLLELGADPEVVWQSIPKDDKNHSRKRFDIIVKRAAKRSDCSY